MKETLKKVALDLGKKFYAVLITAIATLVGEIILGNLKKGFVSFREHRELAKAAKEANAVAAEVEPEVIVAEETKSED